jgi:hypothetical protein
MKRPRLIPCIRFGIVVLASLLSVMGLGNYDISQHRMTNAAMSLPAIKSVDGYQFELITPADLTIPKLGQHQQFKIGLKITNNTAHSRYFLLAPRLMMANSDGVPLFVLPVAYTSQRPIDRRDYQLIAPGKSTTVEGDAVLSNNADGIELSFANPLHYYDRYRVPIAGEYRMSFDYSNQNRGWPELYNGKIIDKPIANIWTGHITTPAKTIKLMNAQ